MRPGIIAQIYDLDDGRHRLDDNYWIVVQPVWREPRLLGGGIVSASSPFLVGGYFELVAADVHAAPPARAFLADVEEMKDAGFALPNARSFRFREKIGRGISERGPEVGGLTKLKDCFPDDLSVSLVKRSVAGIQLQQGVNFGKESSGGW
ncbi:MAG TPA: hypothetical protein VK805_10300 [Candidatus Baltobacteraceae bacterium]|nr:hypothetical protein [Candidatus Baltobacteraceae bacterium]